MEAGEKHRLELKPYQYAAKFPARWNEYYKPEQLLQDLPIIPYLGKFDVEFAALDMRNINPKLILPNLQSALTTGHLGFGAEHTWIYALYLLSQINDFAVVKIVEDFLELKISHQFRETVHKSLVLIAAHKVLKRFPIREATFVMQKYEITETEFVRAFCQEGIGWLGST